MTWLLAAALVTPACTCSKKQTASDGGVDAGAVPVASAKPELPPAPEGQDPRALSLDRGEAPSPAEAEDAFAAHGIGGRAQPSLSWACTPFGGRAACWAKRDQERLPQGIEELEVGTGSFTHVRLASIEGGEVVGADWPAPVDALFGVADPPGEDCETDCDEGGYPNPNRDPDQPAGIGTGACYASCARLEAERHADRVSIDTTLELVGAMGAGRFAFRRTVTRERNSNPYADPALAPSEPEADATGEEAAPVQEDALVPESVDFLVLHDSGGARLVAAEVETFTLLERPSSSAWIARTAEGRVEVFASLPDGGLARGADACLVLAGLEACDGGVAMQTVAPGRAVDPAADAGPTDFEAEVAKLDQPRLRPGLNPYHFAAGGVGPHVAWYDTVFGEKQFLSVLFSTGHGQVKAFLLESADGLAALGPSTVAVRFGDDVCVRAVLGGDEAGTRASTTDAWCGAASSIANVDEDASLEVLSRADGGVTLVEEVAGEVVVHEGAAACRRVNRRPADFTGCR